MDASLKKILRGISLKLRHELEGWHDKKTGMWNPGDLERRLNEIGIWSDRPSKPLDEMPHLCAEDKTARRLVDGYLQLRAEAGVERAAGVAEFVRESAYTWANRLFALRCMEARNIIEEVILQKFAYAGRSLIHQRYLRKNPDAAKGEDDGLFAVLFAEFTARSQELPVLFDPKSPAVALRPSVAALKRCVALLSGTEAVRGQDPATDGVFAAPDAFGWAYQYWNADEKDRVFEMVRTKKGAKIQGADIIPATQLYTEPYMVKFLVQNSLGALWMGMYPDSKLCERWEYYVKDANRAPVTRKPVREITFLDPAEGSGHFHMEAFDLLYLMYEEEAAGEGRTITPREIAAAILNHNLYGIDIDGRSVQIATAAVWMKAKERAPELEAGDLTSFHEHLVATNIRLPKGKDHLELFLQKHPEDKDLRPALELVFQGLEHADELGSLLQIEELVDAVLRRLKEEADKSKGTAVQPGLFEKTLVQGTLPVSVEDYDNWKHDALDRLQTHFGTEAQAADQAQAFFGESASMGLTLFDLLARRYDVVTANPPYMGSKNMGDDLKAYVSRHYAPGKRDLYAAFILRCVELTKPGGRVAMVTQQSWMFLGSFSELRAVDGEKLERLRGGELQGLLRDTAFEQLAHLGEFAFEDSSAAGAFAALFVLSAAKPQADHRLTAFRLIGPKSPTEKDALLLESVACVNSADDHPVVSRPLQQRFLDIPQAPLSYWLRERFFALLGGHSLAKVADVPQGPSLGDAVRYVRFVWEAALPCSQQHDQNKRWIRFDKGGGYRKWHGLNFWSVEWERNGVRVKGAGLPGTCIRNEQFYFRPGWVYSSLARGSLGVRWTNTGLWGSVMAAPILLRKDCQLPIGLVANCRLATAAIRWIRPQIVLSENYVARIPCPPELPNFSKNVETACVALKAWLTGLNPLEREFRSELTPRTALKNYIFGSFREHAVGASLLALEGFSERLVLNAFNLQGDDLVTILGETGTPAGWLPLLTGYDMLPPLPAGLPELPDAVIASLEDYERRQLLPSDAVELKRNLRQLYELGPGVISTGDESDAAEEENDEEEEVLKVGACMPIPAESFIEELSQKLKVHPISIYWLLQEGIESEGWRCPSEERRLFGDRFTVLVLQLLGHRWPKQLEAGEPLPAWVDRDGVIPLTSGGETPLIERVHERLAEDFPGGNLASLQREFEEIIGAPLEQWLAGPFFERHISQFRKRPIAWQLETVASRQAVVPGTKGKKKRVAAGKPVFACLVYYQKLDVDLLPKIRTQYVGLLRGGFETEFRTLEQLANPTGDQQARRLDLEQWTGELHAFDQLLEEVSAIGFCPKTNDNTFERLLRQYGIKDALLSLTASWLRRLSGTIAKGPMSNWVEVATKTELHPDLSKWLQDSMSNLNHFCAVLGPKQPDEKSPPTDPTSKELAPLVCHQAKSMLEGSLKLGCDRWWKPFDEAVLEPLRQESKTAKNEVTKINEELETEGLPFQRRNELGERKHELKTKIKSIKADHDEKSEGAKKVRRQIEKWVCPEAETWEAWLCAQPLFDEVASLDGQRPPPQSIADFITQESRYAPDINDGVRVNIAPIQKAGLLPADVLDPKDADKAIANRAEWRADERRWVREGKLPQPGWWMENERKTRL